VKGLRPPVAGGLRAAARAPRPPGLRARVARPGSPLRALLLALTFAAATAGAEPVAEPPGASVRLTAPRGGQTAERVVTVKASVADYRGDRATLVLNGVPLSVPVNGGRVETAQVLSPGANSIRLFVEQDGRVAEDETSVFAQVPAKDLRVTLTWDTPGTDVDLWVTGPDGEKVLYSHREGKAGGTLDTDVTTGFGPETYTQARLEKGTYRVQAHAYGIARPTRVEVTTVRFEGTPDEERRTFRAVLLETGDVVEVGEFVQR
jgi:uncharacterized protein YfaP (DUF2135 family)